MDKKVSNIGLESSHFVNGPSMGGTRYNISIQDMGINITPEFYTGSAFDTAISGRLRQNLRALRINIEIQYQRSTEPTLIRNLINDIITAFVTNNADSITCYPQAAGIDNFEVVIDTAAYNQQYTNRVNGFSPSISLVSLDEITSIPEYLEAP